ncbi:MAG: hypothetical protein LBU66_03145 [Treponema sp.]|jgi:Mor family transcriptional regulator|nr:hypothetical protein [Treponema sp.]
MKQNLFDDLMAEPSPIEEFPVDLSGDFEQLEGLIGTEAAYKIAEAFAGTTIYIPKHILTIKNYNLIRKKFKAGSTYRELSIEFNYTETHIRNIIHKK